MFGSKKFTALAAILLLLLLWQVGFLNWLSGGRMGNAYDVASPIFLGSIKRACSYFPSAKHRNWFTWIITMLFYVMIFPFVYVLDLAYLLLASLAKRAVAAWKKPWVDDSYFKNGSRDEWKQVFDGIATRGTQGGSDYGTPAQSSTGTLETIEIRDGTSPTPKDGSQPANPQEEAFVPPHLSGRTPVWHPASRVESDGSDDTVIHAGQE